MSKTALSKVRRISANSCFKNINDAESLKMKWTKYLHILNYFINKLEIHEWWFYVVLTKLNTISNTIFSFWDTCNLVLILLFMQNYPKSLLSCVINKTSFHVCQYVSKWESTPTLHMSRSVLFIIYFGFDFTIFSYNN